MTKKDNLKFLFIINSGSGNNTTDWAVLITDYFKLLPHTIELYRLTKNCNTQTIKDKIKVFSPHQVVAVGGDGTIKLVAECLPGTDIALGILPAGSANGLAKELGIPTNPQDALAVLVKGHSKKIHLITINGELCIHLSDIGLNAYVMKKFETLPIRGMWGYFMASLKVLWQHSLMEVEMKIDKKPIKIKAAMIVVANATKYGTGALINPIGTLEDELFEVIAIKKISPREIFKMVITHAPYDTEKTEVFQTDVLWMRSAKKVHFQVDGEYLGKVKEVKAAIIPDALKVIVPERAG
ncbi:MAG: diacylglycerol kinase family protein [Spirosomataceae bacterium]